MVTHRPRVGLGRRAATPGWQCPGVSAHPNSAAGSPLRSAPALVIGILGLLAAVLLPFAPVLADETTVTWPKAGEPPESTTAILPPPAPSV